MVTFKAREKERKEGRQVKVCVRVSVSKREREKPIQIEVDQTGNLLFFVSMPPFFLQDTVFCQMRRALDLIHFIVKESVTESTTKFGFDFSDLTCGIEDDSELVRMDR